MFEKSNDATPQRPAGDRILDAELVVLNLNQAQEQIKSESAWLNSDRNAITPFKSETYASFLLLYTTELN